MWFLGKKEKIEPIIYKYLLDGDSLVKYRKVMDDIIHEAGVRSNGPAAAADILLRVICRLEARVAELEKSNGN